ncbi:mitochondria-eating protein isoform X1 [Cuculus canorus]|uniref:mitochondria-eating protein isoform X1 n=1 Tax=Cuculus canorus TaxID=55661 RepID=UPI0023AA31CA|nr:mitochondria-eating protein isoform X1 [Cuculus canorus]
MADRLRSLVGAESGRALQEKLERWYRDYEINSCDQNLNRCCEIIELNSEIQGQLFAILYETSQEGGHCAGVETIKTRLLPWLRTCFSCTTSGKLFENNLSLTQDSIEKEKQLLGLPSNLNFRLQELEKELTSTRIELSRAKQLLPRSRSPSPRRGVSKSCSPLHLRSYSPGRARRTNASRRAFLVARFGDIYAQERLEAETLLRKYISDMEMVQRIIYAAAVESFHAAKMAYRQFKIHVRETLSIGHSGPESLEDKVLDFIVQHEDLYGVQSSVNEVIRSMNINPKISLPPEIDFIVISTLIRELCCVAFSMQTLVPPLDISVGIDGELFSENKYHRGVESDFTAALVAYHVWPALMENDVVIVKGRAVTKRGALWPCRSRGKSRSRSCSRSRSTSPLLSRHLSRSRSLSPLRSGSSSKWTY